MKRIIQAIALLGVSASVWGLFPNLSGQLSSAQTSIGIADLRKQTNTDDRPNLTLLARTVANFFRGDYAETESTLEIRGTSPGLLFQVYLQVKTLVKSPGQFRSEIVFRDPGGTVGKEYLVISNGDRVWMSSSDLGIYAIVDFQEFKRSNNGFLMGFSSLLFLDASTKVEESITANNISESNVVDLLHSVLLSEKLPIQGSSQQIQGEDYYTYSYNDSLKGLSYNVLVNSDSATVERIELTGQRQDLDIVVTEKIRRRGSPLQINANTFSFPSPAGMQQVESMSIGPF